MNMKISLGAAIAIMLVVAAVTFSITMDYATTNFNTRVTDLKSREQQYDKYSEIDRQVRLNYFGAIDDNLLMDSVARGYVSGIGDTYAVYYSAEEYRKLSQSDEGENVGIGAVVEMSPDDFYLVVNEVYPDSPAQVAGIEPGDLIVKIDDTDLTRENSRQMLDSIVGPQGTQITLVTRRGGTESPPLAMTRRSIPVPTVYSRLLEDSTVGYMRITEFADRTYDQFNRELQKLTDAGATSLVFDLRDTKDSTLNLRSTPRILDKLLPAGVLLSATYKDASTEVLATSDANETTLPMVVLVNAGTTCSSELFAQCVRDFEKGRIVGVTTAGRGVMQDIIKLTDGSAIELTIAYFQSGSGASFNGVGIKPDFEVVLDADWATMDESSDPQLTKAKEVAISMRVTAEGETNPTSEASSGPGTDSFDDQRPDVEGAEESDDSSDSSDDAQPEESPSEDSEDASSEEDGESES